MKILLFINSLVGGGAERVTTILCNEFVTRGCSVQIFLKENIVDYELDQRIKIVHSAPTTKFKGKNLIYKTIRSIVSYVKRFDDTKRVIKEYKPDVIITSWGANLLQVLLASRKIPVVASEHNTFDRKHSLRERFNRFYLNKFCSKVIVLTNYDKNFMSGYLNNIQVIYNPLTFEPIDEQTYNTTFEERHDILACGRLNAYHVKGFDNLLKSFAKVSLEHNLWYLNIAGKGDNESQEYLKQLCKEYGIENRVRFLGFCNNINELMLKHSLFVLSSRSEGFGMVLTEAMSMGCPCISYNLSGPSEIIYHNIDGLLVESQNIDKFSDSISLLIQNKKMRKEFGIKGIYNVKRFTTDNIVKEWILLFESLIK